MDRVIRLINKALEKFSKFIAFPIENAMEARAWQFRLLPGLSWDTDIGDYTSLVIVPMHSMHDSGFRNMGFVPLDENNKPLGVFISGGSDVIHVEGIMAMLHINLEHNRAWSMDCLPKSGLMRIFPMSGKMRNGIALSSFEIFSVPAEEGG